MPETAPTLAFVMASRSEKPLPTASAIGQRIRQARLARGLSQTELGRKIGLSKRMVVYYESQGGTASSVLLVKIADALGVPLATLAGRKEASSRDRQAPPVALRVWKRLKRIEELPPHDRKAVLKMIDAMANQATKRKAG